MSLGAAVWSGAGAALAADPPAGGGVTSSGGDPDAIFASAKAAFESGRYEEAYGAYRRLWAVRQTYDIAANLAQVELELGKKRDAAEHLAYALRTFPMSSSRERKAGMERELSQLRQALGVLRIRVGVDGAEVLVDGQPIGKAPLVDEVFVEPGSRVIEAKHPDYLAARQVIEAKAGSEQGVMLELVRAGDERSPDGPPDVPHGEGPSYLPVIVGGAATAVLMGAAIGLTVAANGNDADAEAKLAELKRANVVCPGPAGCAELKEMRGDKDTFHNLAVASYVGGGIALAGTVGYLVYLQMTKAPARDAVVLPAVVVGPAQQGVWLMGRF